MAWRNKCEIKADSRSREDEHVENLSLAPFVSVCYFVHRWRGDLGEERRDWVGVEMEEEINGGGSGSYKVIGMQFSHMTNLDHN
jgi:hypothetical protein